MYIYIHGRYEDHVDKGLQLPFHVGTCLSLLLIGIWPGFLTKFVFSAYSFPFAIYPGMLLTLIILSNYITYNISYAPGLLPF